MDSLDTLLDARADTLVLGRYRLLERLGAGGFGVVWSAHDEQLRREVAVKRIWLHPHGDASPYGDSSRAHSSRAHISGSPASPCPSAERAAREAQAAARLSHPAIVALYEAEVEGEAFYLISELVHGDTLAALLAAEELGDEEVLALGVALAGALEHAHARGVIHRDVKPQNILVPHDPVERAVGVAKLTDFGGARLAGEDVLTRTGDVLGTLAYMAPEQCEGREATAQADLYSLALVLYEALSGVNPVRGANPAATARRIGSALPPLDRYRRDLPRELTRALDGALAPSPRERGTLPELREALQEALERGLGRRRPHIRALRPSPGPTSVDGVPHVARIPPAPARRREPARGLEPARRPEPARGPEPEYAPAGPTFRAENEPHRPAARSVSSVAQDVRPPPRRLRLPRALWMAAAAALAVWQTVVGRPGVALLALAAAAPLLIPRRVAPQALAAVLAPALGVVGLAGVFPAVAGQAARWRARAALGAVGYWWLCLAEPILGRRLWLRAPLEPASYPGGRAAWEGSLGGGGEQVIPLLSMGVLLGAALWATGALLLPWLVRGRNAALDLVAATVWAAALLAAAPLLDHGLSLSPSQSAPRGALLAAILAAALAVGARALRGPV